MKITRDRIGWTVECPTCGDGKTGLRMAQATRIRAAHVGVCRGAK